MKVITSFIDSKGRPVVTLYVSPSEPQIEARQAIGERSPPPVGIVAMVDTGASRSFVQRSVIEQLGVEPVGEDLVYTASSGPEPELLGVYAVQMFFPGMTGGVLDPDLRVIGSDGMVGLGVQALIGRDLLGRCLLFWNGPESQFTLAFSPPENLS